MDVVVSSSGATAGGAGGGAGASTSGAAAGGTGASGAWANCHQISAAITAAPITAATIIQIVLPAVCGVCNSGICWFSIILRARDYSAALGSTFNSSTCGIWARVVAAFFTAS